MTMTYEQWAARHPQAAADLTAMIAQAQTPTVQHLGKSEAWAQQQIRLQIAQAGGMTWRNNVGATPARCDECGAKQTPVRYGLCNDSAQLNQRFKSSDLIGILPRRVQPHDVGRVIGQFVSIEAKRPGWSFSGKGREAGQAAWLALVAKMGGVATCSTGEVQL